MQTVAQKFQTQLKQLLQQTEFPENNYAFTATHQSCCGIFL